MVPDFGKPFKGNFNFNEQIKTIWVISKINKQETKMLTKTEGMNKTGFKTEKVEIFGYNYDNFEWFVISKQLC